MNYQGIKQTADIDEFLAAPQRAAYAGRTFAFCNLDTLRGFRIWGEPRLEEVKQLADCLAAVISNTAGSPEHYSLVDLRAIESVPSACFKVFLDFSRATREQVATQVVRQAVVRPSGLMGAVCSGFNKLLRPRHQVRHFDSLGAAARWLDPPDADELEVFVAALEMPRVASISAELKRWLSANLQDPSPAAAARALGVSLRTMQRRLNSEDTSFQSLLRQERIEAAQRLLVDSGLKMSAIALEVGFPSSQQLATSFKDVTSMTPSEYQARSRGIIGRPLRAQVPSVAERTT